MKRCVVLAAIPLAVLGLSGRSDAATADTAGTAVAPAVAVVGEPVTFTSTNPCTIACALTWRRPDLGTPRFGGMIVGQGQKITLTFAQPGTYRLVLDLSETCVGTSNLVCHSYADAYVDIVDAAPTPAPMPTSSYTPLVPVRLLDTRSGADTTDGLFAGGGLRTGGSITELTVGARGGVPAAPTAVVLNVTVTESSAAGFVTVFPCGTALPNASNLNFAARQTIAGAVLAKVGSGSKICVYSSAATHLVVDVNGFMSDETDYVATTPARLFDSRPATSTADGLFAAIGVRDAGTTTEIDVGGRLGVSGSAVAVAIEVTVTESTSAGFVTVYPCGSPRPAASSVNFAPGQTVANTVLTRLGTGGKVCFYTSAPTHMLSDLSGFFPATSSYVGVQPARLLDTRPGESTTDGTFAGAGVTPAGTVTQLVVVGRGGIRSNAATVAVNVAVTQAASDGFVAIYPCGTPRPNASNLNYSAGATIANAALARVGTSGRICVFNSATAHLIVDVSGSFP